MTLSNEQFWEYFQVYQRPAYFLPEVRERQESLVRLINKWSPRGGELLEIGFGNGYLLRLLANRYACTGLDLSAKNVELTLQEMARDGITNVRLIAADITKHQFQQKFDVIVLCHVLEHFGDQALRDLLRWLYSLLKPGGALVGAVPYMQNLTLSKRICPECGQIFDPDDHKQSFDKLRLTAFFREAGFQKIHLDTKVIGLETNLKNLLGRVYYLFREGVKGLQFVAQRT
jgi:SAM-dependent methyltransferase